MVEWLLLSAAIGLANLVQSALISLPLKLGEGGRPTPP